MEAPSNGIYIVVGEINLLLANLRKTGKYTSSHSYYENVQDPLSRNLIELKQLLNDQINLADIDPTTFLAPFLEVIKSEETTGPVTGMALTSVNKFISYGLIGINNETTPNCVQQISESITHARFVGTDSGSDEVVLMKILNVLRTLMLSNIGLYLTNSSVCEIMQSCFQIFFESRLTELLRRNAETVLIDMVQLLFARLPQFKEEIKYSAVKKLTMKSDNPRQKKSKKSKSAMPASLSQTVLNKSETKQHSEVKEEHSLPGESEKTEQVENSEQNASNNLTVETKSRNKTISESSSCSSKTNNEASGPDTANTSGLTDQEMNENGGDTTVLASPQLSAESTTSSEVREKTLVADEVTPASNVVKTAADDEEDAEDFVNPRGVRFIQDGPNAANVPYGLPCLRELLRFLISLINSKNSEVMISIGLNLITVGLESGVDHVASYQSLLAYVKDDLAKNLFNLLSTERLSIYANVLRVLFLLFESLRSQLKYQLEFIFTKLMNIIVSESNRVLQEQREMTIEFLLQMLRIPGFAIEMYINYDCCLNCTNLFEDLTKLLSKNAFSVQSLLAANSLSLSALLTIVDNIELENNVKHGMSNERLSFLQNSLQNSKLLPSSGFSAAQIANRPKLSTDSVGKKISSMYKSSAGDTADSTADLQQRVNRMKIDTEKLPSHDQLKSVRIKKRILQQSVDLFNQNPSKSIQFLKDNGIFSSEPNLFMQQLINYVKETPTLDKKVLGDYLSSRKNLNILDEFVKSFDFVNVSIHDSLRLFLETFRLPGEAPLISNVMEHFARHWRQSNPDMGVVNDDAAFTLSYAIIMLNVDQHNHNVKKQSTPMVLEEFKKNLTKVNGGGNFDDKLLENIYTSIRSEEIVMPSEHTGALRDNYLWKVLIRRDRKAEPSSFYIHAPAGSYNQEIFNIVWGQTISALSFVYDKSFELPVIEKSVNGFKKCAQIAAHYTMSDVFDNIVISLCKFTNLSNHLDSIDQLAINFGNSNKAQIACKTVFQLTHNQGDILRDGWKNILDCIIQLYKAKLLPKVLVECEDYLNPKGRIVLIKEEAPIVPKVETSGLFSTLFPFMSSSDVSSARGPSPEDQESIKNAQSCIDECHIEQLIHDTKFLRIDSLLELIKALIFSSQIHDIDLNLSANSGVGQSLNQAASLSSTSSSSGLGSNGSSVKPSTTLSTSTSGMMNSMTSSLDSRVDMDAAVFSLEILIKVVIQNRDRISSVWPMVRNHFYNIIIHSTEYSFFVERTVIGLLRITARLLRREELANEVLASLRMLLLFKKKSIIRRLSRQVAFGIHDLLRTNAANIKSSEDWSNIFAILQVYGAGATAPLLVAQFGSQNLEETFNVVKPHVSSPIKSPESRAMSNEDLASLESKNLDSISNSDRGYTSDSELYQSQAPTPQPSLNSDAQSNSTLISSALSEQALNSVLNRTSGRASSGAINQTNQYKIDLDDEGLGQHDKKAFAKCCETLTFLIRDMAHIYEQNYESCIHCLRTFVEACVLGDRGNTHHAAHNARNESNKKQLPPQKANQAGGKLSKQKSQNDSLANQASHKRSNSPLSETIESDEDDQLVTSYETISIQLLDLLDTLHVKAASVFKEWAEIQRHISQQTDLADQSMVSNLWAKCWCPILQGIARLCCDSNGEVRMHALQYLQRALLVHELQTLSAMEWEACFNKVLFPLLAKLLENIDPRNSTRLEETRMRASSLLCKVFLQHLTTLARLSTFTALWLTILDYMDKYMKSDKSDLLHDVIPESLKNMLLVMETTGLFSQTNSNIKFSQLCVITKDRIESFLPGLWEDLFKSNNLKQLQQQIQQQIAPPPAESVETKGTGDQIEENKKLEDVNSPPAVPADPNPEQIVVNECVVINENENLTSSCMAKSSSSSNIALKQSKSSTEIHDV